MAVRQYIGARYVPRFTGLHDNTQIYEALDVVDNGSGTSYIARKTVPAGTPLTNTDYWFVYGASSGAIYDLQTRMDEAENDIDAAESAIQNLQNSRSFEMGSRKFLFLADSYDAVADFVDTIAADLHCASSVKRTQAGACFVRHDSFSQYSYLNILTNLNPLSASDLATITDIVIFASVNDAPTDDAELRTAMSDLNTYFRTNMPMLQRVYLLSIGWASNNASMQEKITTNLIRYGAFSGRFGWKYIDCTRVMRMCRWNSETDGYHPTTDAAPYLAQACSNAILTGSCSWRVRGLNYRFDITYPAGFGTTTPIRPSDNVMLMVAGCDQAGNIFGSFSRDILANFSDDITYDVYNITFTPQTAYRTPFPIGMRLSYPILRSSKDGVWDAAIFLADSNGIRLSCYGGTSQTMTKQINILTNIDKLFSNANI